MTSSCSHGVPVVDFSAWSLAKDDTDAADADGLGRLAADLYEAFRSIGFVYLTNHGVSEQLIEDVTRVSGEFFSLPSVDKSKYSREVNSNIHGWSSLEREATNPARPGDLKESFDVAPILASKDLWPDQEVEGFKDTMLEFYSVCYLLSQRVLKLMAMGLGLEDNTYFSKRSNPFHKENFTALRCLHYPPLPSSIKENQTRCGEHTDYGLLTLLFQDSVGGLEVCTREGRYVPATPIPGTVLVNIGDLMQRWTADRLVSTKHRVLVLEDEVKNQIPRRSNVFFVHPDEDELITCIGDVEKYPPILSGDYTKQRFYDTYKT